MKLFLKNLPMALLVGVAVVAGHGLLRAADPGPATSMLAPEKTVYTCPMHPKVQSDKPGSCPTCHMALKATKVRETTSTPASTLDHADMKMDASAGMSGMNMNGGSSAMSGAGMGGCSMGSCPMEMGSTDMGAMKMASTSPGKAATMAVSGIPAPSGRGGCGGCR